MYRQLLSFLLGALFLVGLNPFVQAQGKQAKKSQLPNILWITCEDMGPHLGCYGDTYANSPNIDKLAKKSLRYLNCWSNAPVCAPARTTIISGMYPPSTGSEHMRSQTRLPPGFEFYPVLLRRLGYYCTNHTKRDYNLVTGKIWNDTSRKAHYKNRKPGQPFFAIFNLTTTHESQIRNKIKQLVHDPKKAPVPAYHPDVKEVRRDWAQYYDRITQMDSQVGRLLRELEEAGLLENTIIFFYADHGSGMPRGKRHASNSGLHLTLIFHLPERYRGLAPDDYSPGGRTERLVSFVDLAPTLLSLAGSPAPKYYQGKAFLGKQEAKPRDFIFGFRGRMDERVDMVRSVRDKRYVYLRNYMPHKPHGQHVAYQFQTPTTRVWKQLFDMGKLNQAQSYFWKTNQAPEELYDLKTDPDEVKNLADSPQHQEALQRLRKAHRDHVMEIRDVGFMPEPMIHIRSKGSTPYQFGHSKKYPLDRVFSMAQLATMRSKDATQELSKGIKDNDPAVRYWAVMGHLIRGKKEVQKGRQQLRKALSDKSLSVQIAAAETLAHYGNPEDLQPALAVLNKYGNPAKNDVHQCVMALNALDGLGTTVRPVAGQIQSWPKNIKKSSDGRSNYGVPRLIDSIRSNLKKGA